MRLIVAIIVVVAACGGAADRPTQTAGTEAPVNTEAPARSASTTWAEFRRHVEVSAKDIGTTMVEFDGIDIYNDDAVNAKTLELLRLTDSESEWLDTHPPDACYAETHASWSSAMAHIGQAASLFREAVAEHDDSKFKSGNEALTQGVAEAKKMTDSIPTSSFACAT